MPPRHSSCCPRTAWPFWKIAVFWSRSSIPGAQACFTCRNGRFRPLFTAPAAPDLRFRANLSAYLQLLARQEDPDTLFFNRELSIEGDTELGLIVKNMLDAIEWPRIPGFR